MQTEYYHISLALASIVEMPKEVRSDITLNSPTHFCYTLRKFLCFAEKSETFPCVYFDKPHVCFLCALYLVPV